MFGAVICNNVVGKPVGVVAGRNHKQALGNCAARAQLVVLAVVPVVLLWVVDLLAPVLLSAREREEQRLFVGAVTVPLFRGCQRVSMC